MAKEIVPQKLIITMNPDGTTKDAVMLYRLKTDGALDERKVYTMGVRAGLAKLSVDNVLSAAKIHAEKGEKIR